MNKVVRRLLAQTPSVLRPASRSMVINMKITNLNPPQHASMGDVLVYNTYGNPTEVLRIEQPNRCQLKDNEVSVNWLLAPVNPADINTIEGKYPSKPPLPAVPGNEGVGIVTLVGQNVSTLKVGDKVIPSLNNLGTWATGGVYKASHLQKVLPDLGLVEASMLYVNPCTAYRMLKDFVKLQPGDTVIQNGGNSAVGQMVIQLCKLWDIKTVSIIRDRPNVKSMMNHLKDMGADVVLLDTEVRTTNIFSSKQLPPPKLALNCICGQNALNMARHLQENGTMVTYGGMSREPLTLPVSMLIFKNLTFKGFWMTAWSLSHLKHASRKTMFDELSTLFIEGKLRVPPYKLVPFKEYQEAVSNALSDDGRKGVKYILNMRDK